MASLQSLEIEQARLQERYEENPSGRLFAPLADVLRKLGRQDEALELCREGLSRHPAYSSAYVILGKIHLERGDQEGAVDAFEKVLELDRENLLALRQLAKIYEASGELERAEELWTRVASLEPDAGAVEERLEALRRRLEAGPSERPAGASKEEKKEKEAEPAEDGPDDATPAPTEAAPSGEADAPVEKAETPRTTKVASSAEIATITLAQIYYEQGFLRKALEVYEQVQARNPNLEGIDDRVNEVRAEIDRGSETTPPSPTDVALEELGVSPELKPKGGGESSPSATSSVSDSDLLEEVQPEGPIAREPRDRSEKERFDGFRRWLDGISDDSEEHPE